VGAASRPDVAGLEVRIMTPAEQEDQPLSRLDERVDELVRALAGLPNLEGLLVTMRAHEGLVASIGPDFPGAVDILAAADFRLALINVADEVLVLRRWKEANRGRST
jgi:hypothetical protein